MGLTSFATALRLTPKKGLYTTVYEYTFAFAREEQQKNVPLDTAITLWDLLLPHAPSSSFSTKQYELWKRFLKEASHLQVISKDTWTQFLEFTREIDDTFSNHDFEAAWPSIIDEFVAWVREQI